MRRHAILLAVGVLAAAACTPPPPNLDHVIVWTDALETIDDASIGPIFSGADVQGAVHNTTGTTHVHLGYGFDVPAWKDLWAVCDPGAPVTVTPSGRSCPASGWYEYHVELEAVMPVAGTLVTSAAGGAVTARFDGIVTVAPELVSEVFPGDFPVVAHTVDSV